MKKILITTAPACSEEVYARICRGFREKLHDCTFEHITSEKIIGGFIAEMDGEVYDLSIASQLEKMQRQIKG